MTWFFISTTAIFCISAYFLYRQVNDDDSLPTVHIEEEPSPSSPMIIGDRFRILRADELIHILDLNPSLSNIRINLGLSDENWAKDALPFLKTYIEFVQRLPASESHHHAGDGGLVKHTLDVAALALTASSAQSWPPNAKTEDIAKKTAVWRYGIMCAAILHDVGKTITGFVVELYDDPADHDKMLWMPDAGSMADTGKTYYRLEFPDAKSAYAMHAEIAWTFFQALVPPHVRQWIAAVDPTLMIALRSYLSGKKDASPLADLITKADMASVSRDLRAGSRQRFASAKRTPLIETIMDTLREMLSERGAHFSIATTAGGDLFRKGDIVYMMSKNVPDYIRKYLRSTNNRAAGSFPNDNQRIFDTLLEYGAVIPPSHDKHRAISNIKVTFIRQDGNTVDGDFSVLAFNASTLYPDGNYPEEFRGILIPNRSPAPQAMEPEPTPQAMEPEPTPQAMEPEPTPQAMEPEPTPQAMEPEPAPQAMEPEPAPQAMEPEPAPQAMEPEPTPQVSGITLFSIDDILQKHRLVEESMEPTTQPPRHTAKKSAQRSRDALANIMQPVALPHSDSAQNGLAEIRAERENQSKDAPRPVNVRNIEAARPSVEAASSEAALAKKELDQADIKAMQDESSRTALEEVKLQARERGMQFISWLADGLADGTIPVNESGAPIHFIDLGMLLVSPAVFRTYAGGVFNKSDPQSLGPLTQKGFESLKLHTRTKRSSLFRAFTTAENSKQLFFCYLIPEANIKHIIQPSSRPANNTKIRLDIDNDLLTIERDPA